MNVKAGDRVKVFDSLLFEDDVITPLSHTVRPATVVRRYIHPPTEFSPGTDDVVDVIFDHRSDRESKGHFTDALYPIDWKPKEIENE